jgi:hypothetical protein
VQKVCPAAGCGELWATLVGLPQPDSTDPYPTRPRSRSLARADGTTGGSQKCLVMRQVSLRLRVEASAGRFSMRDRLSGVPSASSPFWDDASAYCG